MRHEKVGSQATNPKHTYHPIISKHLSWLNAQKKPAIPQLNPHKFNLEPHEALLGFTMFHKKSNGCSMGNAHDLSLWPLVLRWNEFAPRIMAEVLGPWRNTSLQPTQKRMEKQSPKQNSAN